MASRRVLFGVLSAVLVARAELSLSTSNATSFDCSSLCTARDCGTVGGSILSACRLLLDGHAAPAVGQDQLYGALGSAWTVSEAALTLVRVPECVQHYAGSVSGTAPSECEVCDSSYNYSAADVAGKVVVVPLHTCKVQEKAQRLHAAGAIAMVTIAREADQLLGLYSANAKVYGTPVEWTIPNAAPTVMVGIGTGKALLALLADAEAAAVELRVNLTADFNQWDDLCTPRRRLALSPLRRRASPLHPPCLCRAPVSPDGPTRRRCPPASARATPRPRPRPRPSCACAAPSHDAAARAP